MGYWSQKDERKAQAKKHVDVLYGNYDVQIEHSVINSTVHRMDVMVDAIPQVMSTHVVDMDTVSAILNFTEGKVAALNFASYKNPGGRFMDGSSAQEECLCMESTLYPVLLAHSDYYAYNYTLLNNSLYTNAAIYSEDILFKRGDVSVKCDIITCAAPNFRAAKSYHRVSPTDNYRELKSRIEFMFKVAAFHKVETLILGAWGCGVFGQDPKVVAELMQNTLEYYPYFKKVIFAIPKGYNYDMFKEVFG